MTILVCVASRSDGASRAVRGLLANLHLVSGALALSLMTAGVIIWAFQGFDATLGHVLALTGVAIAFLSDLLKRLHR